MPARLDSINSYLRSVRASVLELASNYPNAELKQKHIDHIRKEIFSILGMLRSCVEYAYADIVDDIIVPNLDPIKDKTIFKKILEKRMTFPHRFKNQSELDSNVVLKKIKSINPAVANAISLVQPYVDTKKVIHKVFEITNTLKHGNVVEEIKTTKDFTLIEDKSKKTPIFEIGDITYVNVVGFDFGDEEIQINNSKDAKVIESSFGNISGRNAQKLTLSNNKIAGRQQKKDITESQLIFTHNNTIHLKGESESLIEIIEKVKEKIETFIQQIYSALPATSDGI